MCVYALVCVRIFVCVIVCLCLCASITCVFATVVVADVLMLGVFLVVMVALWRMTVLLDLFPSHLWVQSSNATPR